MTSTHHERHDSVNAGVFDIAIVGAGAAGLMASIACGRRLRERQVRGRIIALDGATRLGAKILVAGGGRCNVTHYEIDERQYAGSSAHSIRNVLGRFGVAETITFFADLGVTLKREETGKLFPTTDNAHTVLDALLNAARIAGVELRHPWRVAGITPPREGDEFFQIEREGASAQAGSVSPDETLHARRIILAVGGRSLPRSGSDGTGYDFARVLGHSVTARIFPALVPLTIPRDHWLCALSGMTCNVTLELRAAGGKRLRSFTNSMLCTHFGLSGPVVMDMSRYLIGAKFDDPGAHLVVNWLPKIFAQQTDEALRTLGRTTSLRWMSEEGVPDRLARALCAAAGVEAGAPGHSLTREGRRALADLLTQMLLPITGDRGYTYAEVTAGGVPLGEVRLETMESRMCPGLHFCGELLDVDGRIGGFNFQWAWASGHIAGEGAANAL